MQYTLGKSTGNTAGSNEALTAANNARAIGDFAYDDGFNNFDTRHTFNMSLIYPLPFGRGRVMRTSIGRPLRALTMPPTSQPPSSACVRPDALAP